MKNRICAFMFVAVVILSLSACGGKSVSIEPTIWAMSSIQNASDGVAIYCSVNEKDKFPEAEVGDIICNIDGSTIEILNNETSEKWSGTYKSLNSNNKRGVYEATIEGKAYQLVKSVTEYEDGSDARDTLILSCEDYVLNFFNKE